MSILCVGQFKGRFFLIWAILLKKGGRTGENSPKINETRYNGFSGGIMLRIPKIEKYAKMVTFDLVLLILLKPRN